MTKQWLRRVTIATVAIAVAGGFYTVLREQPAAVDAAIVVEAPMRLTIREEGKTRVHDVYAVSAPIAGHVARTALEEGDTVVAGKTLVASIRPLDPPLIDRRTEAELRAARDVAQAAVTLADIELQRAELALNLARSELERAAKLFATRVIPESQLQKAQNDVEIQQALVEAARATIGVRRAELGAAEARLAQPELGTQPGDCCVGIFAPVDGVVLAVHVKSEQSVTSGTLLAEIGDPRRIEVVVDLLSSDATRVRPGTRTSIVDWGGDEALPATVRRVEPAAFTKVSALGIEEQRVNAVIDFDRTDPRLGHGFRVAAELTVWECERCLQVPIAALFRSGPAWQVFRIVDGRLRRTEVAIGRMNNEVAQVLDGVAAGDRVVLHPSDTVGDGTLVELRAE